MRKTDELLQTSGMIIMTPFNTWVSTKISSINMEDTNKTINFDGDYYKIVNVNERVFNNFDTDQFAQFKKIIGQQLSDEPINIINDNLLLTYVNVFADIITETKGTISFVDFKDLKKKYRDNKYVKIINYLLYEINMLFICKNILSSKEKLSKRTTLFLHHVLNKYSISISSSSILKKINDKIEKNVYDITMYVKHTKNDIVKLHTHYVNQNRYKELEECIDYGNIVIYKDPMRPNVNFLQSVSAGMSRNTTLSSISFGLG